MPNWSSRTSSGPISRRNTSTPPSPSSAAANAATGAALASAPSADPAVGAPRWKDLYKRFLSALVLGPLALLAVWLGADAFTALLAVAAAILTWEWVHLCGMRARTFPGAGVPLAVFIAGALAVAERAWIASLVLLAGFLLTWAWSERMRDRTRPGQPALRLALGVLTIGVACLCLIELRHDNEAGKDNVLFLLLMVWTSDIGAYAFGRAFGGPRLWPAVSPNKTWSGALGGLACAMLMAASVAPLLAAGNPARAAAVGAILAVATQAGDLLESALKRQFAVKDTSSLIPGHGGLLDRLDGLLAAAPVAMLLALWFGLGHPLWR